MTISGHAVGQMNPSGFGAGCFGPRASCQPDIVCLSPPQRTEQQTPSIFHSDTKPRGILLCFLSHVLYQAQCSSASIFTIIQCKQRTSEATVSHRTGTAAVSYSLPEKAMKWSSTTNEQGQWGGFGQPSHVCQAAHESLSCTTTRGSSAATFSSPCQHQPAPRAPWRTAKPPSLSPYLWLFAVCSCSISKEWDAVSLRDC